MTDTDLAYVAGFFDGEGCVQIYQRGQSLRATSVIPWHIRATVTNTNHESILALREWFGGTIVTNARHRRPTQRMAWKWVVLSQKAATFLRAILPHLRIKRVEADIALLMQDRIDAYKLESRRGRFRALSDNETAIRSEIHGRLVTLRRSGKCVGA